MPDCLHCPDGHDDPRSKTWGVYMAPTRDGDGQPTTLHVAPSGGSHVAESDAEWLRSLIEGDSADAATIIGEVLAPLHARLAATEFELAEAVRRHRDTAAAVEQARAEERAAIARVRRLHFQYRGLSNFDSCAHCNRGGHEVPWPCDTIKTLNGTHPEPQPPGADELLDLWRAGRRMGENRG